MTRLGASEGQDDISVSMRGLYSEIHVIEINYDGGSFMSPNQEGEESSFQEIQQEVKCQDALIPSGVTKLYWFAYD